MPHDDTPRERCDVRAAAVRQVLIARTRERLCEACARASDAEAPTAVSLRVENADLFVITPDASSLHDVGPAQTSLVDLDGRVVGTAWDRRSAPSSDTAAHAAAHRSGAGRAVASCAGRLAHASTPAAALHAVTDQDGSPSSTHEEPQHHTRSTQ
ncbi:class II aldolase/adducin family protein [uncultured Microbacterium sp.]|uniref:class II aldolase/adducin family protein n=1 Tax=uncultured Microbacterium sp. TaxID=191216 RepID=UPI00260B24E7|nr:class II aldolase/adducin family protein [uncultured Microbacterium sp.]